MPDLIAYFDESGDHGLATVDPDFPIFSLCGVLFETDVYVTQEIPRLVQMKFRHFGTDTVYFHSRDIRKRLGVFHFGGDDGKRVAFLEDVSRLFDGTSGLIIAGVIDKTSLKQQYIFPDNPYSLSLRFCLERINGHLHDIGRVGDRVTCIFEARGDAEDRQLELEFRRICDGANQWGEKFNFRIEFATKRQHVPGLEIADLAAYPIATKILRPAAPNPAYDRIEPRFRRSPKGRIRGWGLKVFP